MRTPTGQNRRTTNALLATGVVAALVALSAGVPGRGCGGEGDSTADVRAESEQAVGATPTLVLRVASSNVKDKLTVLDAAGAVLTTCTSRCTFPLPQGKSVVVRAVPWLGSSFSAWSEGPCDHSTLPRCTVSSSARGKVQVTADFDSLFATQDHRRDHHGHDEHDGDDGDDDDHHQPTPAPTGPPTMSDAEYERLVASHDVLPSTDTSRAAAAAAAARRLAKAKAAVAAYVARHPERQSFFAAPLDTSPGVTRLPDGMIETAIDVTLPPGSTDEPRFDPNAQFTPVAAAPTRDGGGQGSPPGTAPLTGGGDVVRDGGAQGSPGTAPRPPLDGGVRVGTKRFVRVVRQGLDSKYLAFAASLERANDAKNLAALYRQLYRQVPVNLQPTDVTVRGGNSVPVLKKGLADLAKVLPNLNLGEILNNPPGKPATCEEEEFALGKELRTMAFDEYGASGFAWCPDTTFAGKSIMANYFFPQKPYVTCVKDQGLRGSCTAFALASALEEATALNHNRWVNLSEQDLYYWLRSMSGGDETEDGSSFSQYETRFNQGYRLVAETGWPYNQAWYRDESNNAATCSQSDLDFVPPGQAGLITACAMSYPTPASHWDSFDSPANTNSYGCPMYCSATSAHGSKLCVDLHTPGSEQVCIRLSPPANGVERFSPSFIAAAYDPDDADTSIELMKLGLKLGNTLVIGFDTNKYFDDVRVNGWVRYSQKPAGDLGSRGGHAVHVVGYITNAQLAAHPEIKFPAKGTDDEEYTPGAGGGYFIVKNSWGICMADNGYIYLPFQYFKDFGHDALFMFGG